MITLIIIFLGLGFLTVLGVGAFFVVENTLGTPRRVRLARAGYDISVARARAELEIERAQAEAEVLRWRRDQVLESRKEQDKELPAAARDIPRTHAPGEALRGEVVDWGAKR